MKRVIISTILLIILSAASLCAETVMIYTEDSWYTEERRMGEEYIAYAIEDGLMDSLFDAGHIIYNDYAPPMYETDFSDRNRPSYRIARSGGARILFEIKITYENNGEEINSLPAEVIFRLTDIQSDSILDSGSLDVRDFIGKPSDAPRDACSRAGTALAGILLRFL